MSTRSRPCVAVSVVRIIPRRELGGDERCADDDDGDLRERDPHQPHLDEVVVAGEPRVGLLLGGEERGEADHEDAGHDERDHRPALRPELRPLRVQRARHATDLSAPIATVGVARRVPRQPEVGLLERRFARAKLLEPDLPRHEQLGDPVRGDSLDRHPVATARDRGGADAREQPHGGMGVGRPDLDPLARGARDQLAHRDVGQQAALSDHDQVIRGVLELGSCGGSRRTRSGPPRQGGAASRASTGCLRDPGRSSARPVSGSADRRAARPRSRDAAASRARTLRPVRLATFESPTSLSTSSARPGRDPVALGEPAEVASRGPARMERPRVEQRSDDGERPLHASGTRLPCTSASPASARGEAEQQVHRRGLACSVRPDEARDPAGANRDREIVDRDGAAVSLGQPAGLDDRLHASGTVRVRSARSRRAAVVTFGTDPPVRRRPRLTLWGEAEDRGSA